jgi:diguanylate cyclase (GGDEF)-like protein
MFSRVCSLFSTADVDRRETEVWGGIMSEGEIVQRWNQRFLYLFWFSLALYIILALIGVWLHPAAEMSQLFTITVFHPAVFLALLVVGVQVASRQFPHQMPAFLVTATYCAVYVIAHALFDLASPAFVLVLPVMFSTVYLKKRIVALATGLSLLEFITLYLQVYRYLAGVSYMDVFVIFVILVIAGGVCLLMVGRAQELAQSLNESAKVRQELMMQNVWMQRMSKFDALTELYNRVTFQDHVSRLVEVCGKHDISLHLAVVDIDDFKQINDTYGHDVGDEVLTQFAAHIRESLPDDFFVARYGGEEFVVVATELAYHDFVTHMEDLRMSVSANTFCGQSLTVSIGVHSLGPGETEDVFFRLADQGLYWSKNHGKNRLGFAEQVTANP